MSAAGDAKVYTWKLWDEASNKPAGPTLTFDRITTIIGATLAKPFLVGWAANFTIGAVAAGVEELRLRGTSAADILEMLSSVDGITSFIDDNKLGYKDYTSERSDEGTVAHTYLEDLCQTRLLMGEAEALAVAAAVQEKNPESYEGAISKWWLKHKPEVVASEISLYSLKHRFQGTVDLVRRMPDGALRITDLKTRKAGGSAYDSDKIQTGAYEIAWNEMFPADPCTQRTVLIAREDGTITESAAKQPADLFLDLVSVFRKLKERSA